MESWWFNKKEMRLIADLMVTKLLSLPDNSELSVMDLFAQVLKCEWASGLDSEGYPIRGYKISDIELANGTFLHNYIKWDFNNGVWCSDIKQCFNLDEQFSKKVKKKGFIVDPAISSSCRRMGYPCCVRDIYRNGHNLILSFNDVEEKEVVKDNIIRYYVREIVETRHYQDRDSENKLACYDRVKPLQLWRIPKGSQTGVIRVVDGYYFFTVIKGKGCFESLYWRYEKVEKKKAKWEKYEVKELMKIYQSAVARCNKADINTEAPQKARFQITNMGKSDLLIFVVDTSRFVTTEYEE